MACRAVESISLGGGISQEYDTTMVDASSGISYSDIVATSGNKKNYRQNIIAVITFYLNKKSLHMQTFSGLLPLIMQVEYWF